MEATPRTRCGRCTGTKAPAFRPFTRLSLVETSCIHVFIVSRLPDYSMLIKSYTYNMLELNRK